MTETNYNEFTAEFNLGPSTQVANEQLLDAQRNRDVVDRVFTEIGFDRLFLDNKQGAKTPHFHAKDANTPLVLHIDDDVDLVDAVTSRLRASGFRVASALDGVTGMQSALLHPASAIILDYDMPNGRGDVVLDLLKANENTKDIPVIVLTAVHKKGLKRHMLNKGADVFMTKPFEFDELQATVTELLESCDDE